MNSEDTKAIMHRFLMALTQRSPADAAGLLTPNVVAHFAGLPEAIQGREAWTQLFSAYVAAFPDIEITVHDEIAEGNTATARWSWSGTHKGPFMNIPPTGKAVSGIAGLGVYRVDGGQIDEEWVIEDTMSLLQQLGVIPQPQAAATA